MGDDRVKYTGGGKYAGQAGARMGPCSDQIKPLQLLALVVRPKPRTLGQHGLKAERCTAVRRQPVLKIQGRQYARGDNFLLKSRQQRCLKAPEHRLAVRLSSSRPVCTALEVGHWRQHVEGIAPRWRQRRIRRRWTMQVHAEVLGQQVPIKDVGQQLPVTWPERNRVVGNLGILAPSPEIPDKEAHGESALFNAAVRPAPPVLRRDQIFVGCR